MYTNGWIEWNCTMDNPIRLVHLFQSHTNKVSSWGDRDVSGGSEDGESEDASGKTLLHMDIIRQVLREEQARCRCMYSIVYLYFYCCCAYCDNMNPLLSGSFDLREGSGGSLCEGGRVGHGVVWIRWDGNETEVSIHRDMISVESYDSDPIITCYHCREFPRAVAVLKRAVAPPPRKTDYFDEGETVQVINFPLTYC